MVKMMLVFLVALVLSTNPVKATDCLSVFASLSSCKSYLGNSLPVLPGTQCCDAATNVVSMADTESLCHCLRQSPISSSFIPSKAQQLPSLCNLNRFVPLTNCLVPSGENNVFPLPPDTPLPPLVPFPPLLPTVHFPCVSVSDSPSGPSSGSACAAATNSAYPVSPVGPHSSSSGRINPCSSRRKNWNLLSFLFIGFVGFLWSADDDKNFEIFYRQSLS
ncbi:hypothetical protein Sango_1366200 [Sesamum angolense]|uniref:Bifunctional inhibitor/plant lipid transfer protein/seed storage helical domain-containing protein n=1 Tax=Sesamum angolense TaxID=2727404 RepID=A0AAE1WTH5_9LAMI|nr:hypothetical protein Sango_1366200 [Sesamum angolense]